MAKREKKETFEDRVFENHRLTHEGMGMVLGTGGSVLHDGEVITDPKALPTKGDLAAGSQEAIAAADDFYEGEIQRLSAERARMHARAKAAAKTTGAGESSPPAEDEAVGGLVHQDQDQSSGRISPQTAATPAEPEGKVSATKESPEAKETAKEMTTEEKKAVKESGKAVK